MIACFGRWYSIYFCFFSFVVSTPSSVEYTGWPGDTENAEALFWYDIAFKSVASSGNATVPFLPDGYIYNIDLSLLYNMPDTEEKCLLSSGIVIFVKLIVLVSFSGFFKVFNVDGSTSSFIDELLNAFLLIVLTPSPIVTLSNFWQ